MQRVFLLCDPLSSKGWQQTAILVWMYWFSTNARTDVTLEISRLRSIWQGFGVVEIFGFEISIVSDWYISVSLYFYVQTLFSSLEAMNLFGFMPEKYQKSFLFGLASV